VSTDEPQMTEEQLRAAYEEEIRKIRVEHVLLENVVTMVNLGMRRTGLMPGTEDERDAAQVRTSIESVRALLPIVEVHAPEQAEAIRSALSQMQMAYVQITGGGSEAGEAAPPTPEQAPPPASDKPPSSGKLWVPGQ